MAAGLTIVYDKIGDILYVNCVKPYHEQDSDEIGDGIVARFHPETGEIENLEILFFSKRLENDSILEIPVAADVRLIAEAV